MLLQWLLLLCRLKAGLVKCKVGSRQTRVPRRLGSGVKSEEEQLESVEQVPAVLLGLQVFILKALGYRFSCPNPRIH